MTLIESAPPRPDLPVEPVWREVEAGFWVASTEGMFLGTVERHDDAGAARAALGLVAAAQPLGRRRGRRSGRNGRTGAIR